MTLLSVAVALVGVLGLLNLVLVLGVVRRLRDHGERIAVVQGYQVDDVTIRGAGEGVDPFTATTTDGATTGSTDLVEPTLVGVFSPDCPSCEGQLAPFLAYAAAFPGGPRRTLAVIAGEGGARYLGPLSAVAAVVQERELGPVQKAFGVRGFPAFAVVVDGRIAQSSHKVDELPLHQPA